MTDDAFLQAFMDCTLPNERFHHRDHLRLAWLLVRRLGVAQGGIVIGQGIRRFAASHGHAPRYHETMTQFWVRIVGHMVQARPDIEDFDTFLGAFPQLLDKSLPFRHWSRETMGSAAARAGWVDPDLLGLPR